MISKELLDKFKKLYQEKFNITLTDEETTEMATNLVNLMKILLKPDPKPDDAEEQVNERRQNEIVRATPYQ